MLRAREFGGRFLAAEFVNHHAVAIGHAFFRVAVIQRLDPDERGGRGRTPVRVARAGEDAADGDIFGRGKMRDFVFEAALQIDGFNIAREKGRGDVERIRPANFFHEHVLAVRRHFERTNQSGFADGLALGGAGIDDGELRSRVKIEQVFVKRIGEQILKRARRRGFAVGFARLRSDRRMRALGRFAAARDDGLTEEMLRVGHPLKARAENGVQRDVPQSVENAARGVGDPEFDCVRLITRDGEHLPIGRPQRKSEISAGGNGQWFFHACRGVLEREADVARRAMRAVADGIDAITRERDQRLRKFGNRRIQRALHEHDAVAFRTEGDEGRGRGVEDFAHRRRGLMKFSVGGPARGWQRHDGRQTENGQRGNQQNGGARLNTTRF